MTSTDTVRWPPKVKSNLNRCFRCFTFIIPLPRCQNLYHRRLILPLRFRPGHSLLHRRPEIRHRRRRHHHRWFGARERWKENWS